MSSNFLVLDPQFMDQFQVR